MGFRARLGRQKKSDLKSQLAVGKALASTKPSAREELKRAHIVCAALDTASHPICDREACDAESLQRALVPAAEREACEAKRLQPALVPPWRRYKSKPENSA